MLFFSIMLVIISSLYLFGRIYYKVKGRDGAYEGDFRGDGFAQVMAGFFIINIVVFILISLITYSTNAYKIEDLQKVKTYETILAEKADVLTGQFTNYLVEIYPNLEKSIFEKISPQNVSIYLVKYPELRSSETIRKLVDEISKLQDAVYQQKLDAAAIQRDINFYNKNPWVLIKF